MTFEEYWPSLVDRVFRRHEKLVGPEELVFRLTCIYGETMVDGLESYFERRSNEYELDQVSLIGNGLGDVAAEFQQARRLMFGDQPLTESIVSPVIERLLLECDSDRDLVAQIDLRYERLIELLPQVIDRRNEIGIIHSLFTADPEEC